MSTTVSRHSTDDGYIHNIYTYIYIGLMTFTEVRRLVEHIRSDVTCEVVLPVLQRGTHLPQLLWVIRSVYYRSILGIDYLT